MRPCHCHRDSGDDKLQGSEKKDHPGTMGMMGTILALLERGSHGRSIICETTWDANVADVIHCLTTEVISDGTWESLIFRLNTMRDYKRRVAPRHMGCRPG